MTVRIVIASQKGGVGKTTVCLNLSIALAEKGKRVLLSDLDPQGGIGHSLAKGDTALSGLAELIMKQEDAKDVILQTKCENLSLLNRGRLSPIDVCEYEQAINSPGLLHGIIDTCEKGFDYVLFDTPSGLGMATRAALSSADYVLIPMQAGPLALRSLSQIMEVIEHVKKNENPSLKLIGLLPIMVEKVNDHSISVLSTLWRDFESVMETVIPRADIFVEASSEGLPLAYLGGSVSPEAKRFDLLADEVEDLINKMNRTELRNVERTRREIL